VTEDATLEEIVKVMEEKHVKRLPVLRKDKLVGIVTRANLPQVVADFARDVPDPTADDDHIRNRVFAAIEDNDWSPIALTVTVRDGVVQLGGVISDERLRLAAIVAAENVSGVRKLHDHLRWVEPIPGAYF
jgi:predicted transcriptional regulator